MPEFKFFERCFCITTTTGDGSITIDTAVTSAFNTPAEAGASDGDTSTWLLEEGNDYEIFIGSIMGSAITRDTVIQSKIEGVVGTDKMELLGNATVRCVPSAHQQLIPPQIAVSDGSLALWDGNNRKLKAGSIPGTVVAKNVGTSGDAVPLLNTKNAWSGSQRIVETALTSATGWDGDAAQRLGVNVNGSLFTVANPSTVPASGVYIAINIVFTTSHGVSFGNLFRGMSKYTPTATAGAKDHLIFKSDGTNLDLISVSSDYTS